MMRVAIVGPCGSGKTVLANRLRASGYDVHEIAQEHSFVPDLWQRVRPERLIFLDVELETIRARLGGDWSESDVAEQRARLSHARTHSGLCVATDHLTEDQVAQRVLEFLGASDNRRQTADIRLLWHLLSVICYLSSDF